MRKKGLFRYGQPFVNYTTPVLVPINDHAHEALAALSPDRKALVWVHSARYPEHHRFAFAVFQRIAEILGMSVEDVLESIKYDTGRWDYVTLWDGRKTPRTHSIAFESMPQSDFQQFWNDTLAVLKDRLPEEAYQEIAEMLKPQTEKDQ